MIINDFKVFSLTLMLVLVGLTACKQEELPVQIESEAFEQVSLAVSNLDLGNVEQFINDEPVFYEQLMAAEGISEVSKAKILQYEAAQKTEIFQSVFTQVESQNQTDETQTNQELLNKFNTYLAIIEGVTKEESDIYMLIKAQNQISLRGCYWHYVTSQYGCGFYEGCLQYGWSNRCGTPIVGMKYEYCDGYYSSVSHPVYVSICGCNC